MASRIRRISEVVVVTVLLILVVGGQILVLGAVLVAALGPDRGDPHGYTVVFGILFVALLLLLAQLLGLVRSWLRARR